MRSWSATVPRKGEARRRAPRGDSREDWYSPDRSCGACTGGVMLTTRHMKARQSRHVALPSSPGHRLWKPCHGSLWCTRAQGEANRLANRGALKLGGLNRFASARTVQGAIAGHHRAASGSERRAGEVGDAHPIHHEGARSLLSLLGIAEAACVAKRHATAPFGGGRGAASSAHAAGVVA